MSTPPLPSDPNRPTGPAELDPIELASGRLDNSLSPEDTVRALENPQVAGLIERFAAVRQHLQTPPAIDAALRDQHLDAVLAAFESGAEVVSLDAARERRIKRWGTVLTAAAAVAVLGAVVGTLVTRGPSQDVVTSADVSVTRNENAGSDAAGVAVAAAEVTAAGAPEAAAPTESVAADTMIAAAAKESGTASQQADLVVVSDPAQLRTLATALIADINAGVRVLPVNPCSGIEGTAIAPILINQQEALLVVAPSIDTPNSLSVVVLPSCRIESTSTN